MKKNMFMQWLTSKMQLVAYTNKPRVIRVYNKQGEAPERILTEVEPNKFQDDVQGKLITLDPMTRIPMGI